MLRALFALAGLAGCVLLVLATTSTIIEIRVLTTSDLAIDADTELTGMDRHGPALLVLAGLALVMLLGALRAAARPAAIAVAATGLVTLGIALVSDLPELDDTGEVGELYEGARASAESGYYFETAGGALLLLSGAGLLVLGGRSSTPREKDDKDPKAGGEPTPADDWFVNDLG